jgi:hypothetical protein
MPYLIGMDEAGYGPNLGPLVISVSVWWLPENVADADLYDVLAECVRHGDEACDTLSTTGLPDARIAIADSKLLYHPGGGLALLERGLLSVLSALGHDACDWRTLWQVLAANSGAHLEPDPWYAPFDRPLPWACEMDEVREAANRLRDVLQSTGVRCCAVASRAVFPEEFNARCEEFDSKGEALTQFTLELLRDSLEPLDPHPVCVTCDKHGGRHYYAGQLQQLAGDELIEIRRESPAVSTYRFGPAARRVEVSFRVGGEQFLPTALASMASKYLRELAMLPLNEFWCAEVPELRPTAGYPNDAKRFKREISKRQKALAIGDGRLWRKR